MRDREHPVEGLAVAGADHATRLEAALARLGARRAMWWERAESPPRTRRPRPLNSTRFRNGGAAEVSDRRRRGVARPAAPASPSGRIEKTRLTSAATRPAICPEPQSTRSTKRNPAKARAAGVSRSGHAARGRDIRIRIVAAASRLCRRGRQS